MSDQNSTNTVKSVDDSTKIDKNSTKSVESSTKISSKSVDDSTKIDKIPQKVTEKIIKKTGNISEFVEDSTKIQQKSVDDSTKIAEVKPHKKKVSTKSIENLNRKGRKPKKSVDDSTKSIENSVELPKQGFNFPVKFLIIAAFIAGGTLGFLGLWNWWKNQKKSNKSPDDVIQVYDETYMPTQEELEAIAAMEKQQN